ncbi:hypothetical protein KP78_15890 [Jeotgalibacillus soli]|uniref:Uncharacterized protein n=2 Tax=Jeotgalibacillus soli TaxID=889306 RepID=A0A0C2VGZ1_9BACL|nr:hypothetical protein KP78_15890 [Jeotgalibacillus soli]
MADASLNSNKINAIHFPLHCLKEVALLKENYIMALSAPLDVLN